MAGPSVGHGAENCQWMHTVEIFLIKGDKAVILAGLASYTRSRDDSRSACQFRADFQSRISQGLPGCNHRELREPVQQNNLAGVKMLSRIVIATFRAILAA